MNYHSVKISSSANVASRSVVIGDVAIGDDSTVLYFSVLRGDAAPIVIGKGVNIQENCTIHTSAEHPVEVGDLVTVGHNVILHGCTIGEKSLIGMGSIILDGAQIGKECLIGAGSLITKNMVVPDGSLVLGSPAKVKRALTDEEKKHILEGSLKYIQIGKDLKENQVL